MKQFAVALSLRVNLIVGSLGDKVINGMVGHLFKAVVRRAEVWGFFSSSIRCNLKSLKFCSSHFQITGMKSNMPL